MERMEDENGTGIKEEGEMKKQQMDGGNGMESRGQRANSPFPKA
jgi:hypothetical protein